MEVDDQNRDPGVAGNGTEDCSLVDNPDPNIFSGGEEDSRNFGAWLKPRGHSGRSRGRSHGGDRNPNSDGRVGNEGKDPDTWQHGLEPPSLFSTRDGRSCRGSVHAAVHLSSTTVFPHLEKPKPVGIISPVDEGTSSRPEAHSVASSLGPEINPDFTPPSLDNVAAPCSDHIAAPCPYLALVPMSHFYNGIGTSAPPSFQISTQTPSIHAHLPPLY